MYTRSSVLLVVAIVATSCGADVNASCDNYVAAWEACVNEAFADDENLKESTLATLDGTCETYASHTGKAAKESARILDCYADSIDAADCGDADAYALAISGISSCL